MFNEKVRMAKSSSNGWLAIWAPILSFVGIFVQIPAGLLHLTLGNYVYVKDALTALALAIAIFDHQFLNYLFSRRPLVLAVAGIFLIIFTAAAFNSASRVEAFLVLKWLMMWIVAIFAGHRFAFADSKIRISLLSLISIFALCEILVGLWEISHQQFFLATDNKTVDQTLAGIDVARMNTLDGLVRVRGLQRTVFQFSNDMGVIALASAYVSIVTRVRVVKIVGVLICLSSIYCCANSGGRSGLLGIGFGALGLIVGYSAWRLKFSARIASVSIAVLAFSGLVITAIGPAQIFSAFSKAREGTSAILLESSFIREEYWGDTVQHILNSSVRTFFGSIVGMTEVQDGRVVATLDNQYIWFFYHFGFIGLFSISGALIWYSFSVNGAMRKLAILLVGLICLSIGESIGRDAIFLFSSFVLLFVFGLIDSKSAKLMYYEELK